MFLKQLTRHEQNIFLELAVHVSRADNVISEKETVLFREYSHELGRKLDIDFDNARNIDEIAKEISDISVRSKTIIFLELMGLAMCDEFDASEKELINKLAVILGIDSKKITEMHDALAELSIVYNKIGKFLE